MLLYLKLFILMDSVEFNVSQKINKQLKGDSVQSFAKPSLLFQKNFHPLISSKKGNFNVTAFWTDMCQLINPAHNYL